MNAIEEKISKFSVQIIELLDKKAKSDLINLSSNEIRNYVERYTVGANGEWGFSVNQNIHKKIPIEIFNEINELWEAL
jgi:hypothetical protein